MVARRLPQAETAWRPPSFTSPPSAASSAPNHIRARRAGMAAAAFVSDALLFGRARPRGRARRPPRRASARTSPSGGNCPSGNAPRRRPPSDARVHPRSSLRDLRSAHALDSRVAFDDAAAELSRVGGRGVEPASTTRRGGLRRRRRRRIPTPPPLRIAPPDVRGPRPSEVAVRGARVGRILGTLAAPARGYPPPSRGPQRRACSRTPAAARRWRTSFPSSR